MYFVVVPVPFLGQIIQQFQVSFARNLFVASLAFDTDWILLAVGRLWPLSLACQREPASALAVWLVGRTWVGGLMDAWVHHAWTGG